MSAFSAPLPTTVPFVSNDTEHSFFVHRVYCVGRNYADHAKEMGSDGREPPFFFCKPADAVVAVPNGQQRILSFPYPTDNLNHEVELVVALGQGGRDLTLDQAKDCIAGYAVGFDMTKRDLQAGAKQAGKPWDTGKAFDQSAIISPIVQQSGVLRQAGISLWKNQVLQQDSDIQHMIWAVDEILVELSKYFELRAGDLIYTGTPAGVGQVLPGDTLLGSIDGVGRLAVQY